MKLNLVKTISGLVPADPDSEDSYKKLKNGGMVTAEIKQVRNVKFFRKYFALLNVGFENWNPGEVDSRYGVPEKNFDRFRRDVTILAGFYHTVVRLNGEVRIEAKSISFANMEEDEFEKLYNQTINVLLKHVYGEGMRREELDNIVNTYLSFI